MDFQDEQPLVSVIIGTYNRANLIIKCINSILAQTYKNIEIIIVNDASIDNTADVLNKIQNKYPDIIKLVHNKINRGIAYNSNLAYSISKGKYIALIGDDDEWIDNKKIETQLEIFKTKDNIGLVTSHWIDVYHGEKLNKHLPITPKNQKSRILRGNNIFCGSTALIDREVWIRVNGMDTNLQKGTDSELFRSIIFAGYKVTILQNVTTSVYLDSNNRMTLENKPSNIKKALYAHFYLIKKYNFQFIKYPKALLYRLKTILILLIKMIKYNGKC